MSQNVAYYRVNKPDSDGMSEYGDTIAIKNYPEESVTYNFTNGNVYTTKDEEGTVIPNINDFPLFASEKAFKEQWGL